MFFASVPVRVCFFAVYSISREKTGCNRQFRRAVRKGALARRSHALPFTTKQWEKAAVRASASADALNTNNSVHRFAICAEAKRRDAPPPRTPASADALYTPQERVRRFYSCASSAAHSITAAPIPSRSLSISPSTSQPDSVANTDSKHIITDATAGGVIFCATTCSV